MIKHLGPDCQNCPNYQDFYHVYKQDDEACQAVVVTLESEGLKAEYEAAEFVCTAIHRSNCNAQMKFGQVTIKP